MPALPWKTQRQAESDREYLVLASFLPLKRWAATPRFFSAVRSIRKQLDGARGLYGYSLKAQPLGRRYWTLSMWEEEAALMDFVRTAPHAVVMSSLVRDMGPTRFVRWSVSGSAAPPSWEDALGLLES